MRYLYTTLSNFVDSAIRYSLLKDDIIDFPYFFINSNFFAGFFFFLLCFAFIHSLLFKLMKYFNATPRVSVAKFPIVNRINSAFVARDKLQM
jgi:hypothetical protein